MVFDQMFDLLAHPRFTNFNVLKQYQTEKKNSRETAGNKEDVMCFSIQILSVHFLFR